MCNVWTEAGNRNAVNVRNPVPDELIHQTSYQSLFATVQLC